MMRYFLLISVSLFGIFQNINAQDTLSYTLFNPKGLLMNEMECYPVYDSINRRSNFFFFDTQYVLYSAYNDTLGKIRNHSIPREKATSYLVGHAYTQKELRLLFVNNRKNNFRELVIDTGNVTPKFTGSNALANDEIFLVSFPYKGKNLILTTKQNSPSLKLFQFDDEQLLLLKEFNLDPVNTKSVVISDFLLQKDTSLLSAEWINNNCPIGPVSAKKEVKMFQHKNLLFITIDKKVPGQTVLLKMDLEALKTSYIFIKDECSAENPITSSYIFEDHLLQLSLCNRELKLLNYNLTTEQYEEAISENFKKRGLPDSLIIEPATGISSSAYDQKNLSFTALLNQMATGDPFISAYSDSAQLHLQFGIVRNNSGGSANSSVSKTGSGSGSGNGQGGGKGQQTKATNNNIPQAQPNHEKGSGMGNKKMREHLLPDNKLKIESDFDKNLNRYHFHKTTHTSILLNRTSYKPIAAEEPERFFYAIKDFKKILKENPNNQCITLFKKNNAYIISYINTATRGHILIEFK